MVSAAGLKVATHDKGASPATFIDRLGEESLLRYQQVYNLSVSPQSSREDLVWAVKHHFYGHEVVDENSLIWGFVQALKRDSSSDSSSSCMYSS
eukprot:gene13064-13191_t